MFKPYDGSEPFIFVCYSRRNKKIVIPVLEAMSKSGYRIWYDQGIGWGAQFQDEIVSHIDKCHALLLFMSRDSSVSKWCQDEILEALEEEKIIVRIDIEKVRPPKWLTMRLRRFQSDSLFRYKDIHSFVEQIEFQQVFLACKSHNIVTTSENWNNLNDYFSNKSISHLYDAASGDSNGSNQDSINQLVNKANSIAQLIQNIGKTRSIDVKSSDTFQKLSSELDRLDRLLHNDTGWNEEIKRVLDDV